MNNSDLLNAIGNIDPEYINEAYSSHYSSSKMYRYHHYLIIAAALLLLIITGNMLKNKLEGQYKPIEESALELTSDSSGNLENEETFGLTAIPSDQDKSDSINEENVYVPYMIMVDGELYKDSGKIYPENLIDNTQKEKALSYIDGTPTENGQQNFDESLNTVYTRIDENQLAVLVDETYLIFEKISTDN